MSKFTPGPWKAYNMVASDGSTMTPQEIGDYVRDSILVNPDNTDFLYVSCTKEDGDYDVCHVGNGPDGPYNADLIAAAPEMYEALEYLIDIMWQGESEKCVGLHERSIYDKTTAALAKARGEVEA